MRTLVVWAHPCEDSFGGAVHEAVLSGLRSGGHEIRCIDLYRDQFNAVMGREEWEAYIRFEPLLDEHTQRYTDDLLWAEMLVFVYPTWWFGLPAILKGWCERVFVPGVAFTVRPGHAGPTPGLRHVRHIVGVSTYGSPWSTVKRHGDVGRRTVSWSLRLICSRTCRTTWLALYDLDHADEDARRQFLDRVRQQLSGTPRPGTSAQRRLVRLTQSAWLTRFAR